MKRYELAVNAFFQLPLILCLTMLLVTAYPVNLSIILLLYLCGLIDLVYAKLPLLRRRMFASFGPGLIPTKRRQAYYRGYKRIALGASFNLLTLLHYHMITTGF